MADDASTASSQFQHHVPRFYLGGWSTSVNGLHKRVWVYEQGKEPRAAAIKKTGGRDNTYAVITSDGSVDLKTVEEYLGRIESQTGKVFPQIFQRKSLSPLEKRIIAVFVSVFYRRDTYTFDKFVPEKLAPTLPALRDEMLAYAEAAEVAEDVKARYRTAVHKAIELAGENIDSITSQSVLYSESFADAVFNKLNWCFLYSKEPRFVTSDCPVVFDRHRGIKDFARGHILFPISNQIVLWMTQWPILANCYVPISEDLVNNINARIIINAHQQVYASHRTPEIKVFVDKFVSAGLPYTNKSSGADKK